MKIVDGAHEFPGCCELTGDGQGPFVETGQLIHDQAQNGGTQYVSLRVIDVLAAFIGGCGAHGRGALEEQIEQLQATVAAQEAELLRLRRLEANVAMTLRHGAVVKGGEIHIRHATATELRQAEPRGRRRKAAPSA